VADYFLVRQKRGPDWDHSRGRREQDGWDEHATFMDALVDEGVIVLGGPVGDVNGDETLLVVAVESEEAIRGRLAPDPWAGSLLTVVSVEPWTVWLRGAASPAPPGREQA
jgi:uncharacterized protein YciI